MGYDSVKKKRAEFTKTAKELNGKKVVVSWLPTSTKPFRPGPLIWGTLEIGKNGRVLLKSERGITYPLNFEEIEFIRSDKR